MIPRAIDETDRRHRTLQSITLALALATASALSAPARGVDCNSNGTDDEIDLAAGTSFDCNSNGSPDECDVSDPLGFRQKLTTDRGWVGDQFGYAVSISGDVLIVGAHFADEPESRSGDAHVYRRNGTTWGYEAHLVAYDRAADDNFGDAVAAGSSVVVIGAPESDDAGTSSGSVYVFRHRSGPVPGWFEEAKLTASDAAAGDRFGNAVAVTQDRILIGARTDDSPLFNAGSAYVFRYTGSEWEQEAKLLAPNASSSDEFGTAVAIDGDTALIGAISEDDGANGAGAVYSFRRLASAWTFEQKFYSDDIAAFDDFSYAIAICGDRALIGAPGDDDGGNLSGSAYVFERSGPTWSQSAKLTASPAMSGDRFGRSVALSGSWALVGAPWSSAVSYQAGAAFLFQAGGATWTQRTRVLPAAEDTHGQFGLAVAVDGGSAVVGVNTADGVGYGTGAAIAWHLTTDCNENGLLDECEVAAGSGADCNANGMPDECDLAAGCSRDDNGNLVPDECDPDCNHNGVIDSLDLTGGTSTDCDSNGVPDECQPDCNTNGVADACDLAGGTGEDCNTNGVLDACETSLDCNLNATPDICEIAAGSGTDCNRNDVMDECDIAAGTSTDDDENGLPDTCDRTLAGYWRFDFMGDTGCQFLDTYLSEVRYLRFDDQARVLESWIETGGQYLKLNYPSTDGPSYNRYSLFDEQTDNTDRMFYFTFFDNVDGATRIQERVIVNDGSHNPGEETTAEDGASRIEGIMEPTGQQIQGIYQFISSGATWCGDFVANRLAGEPPPLPVVIDVKGLDLVLSTTALTRPGSVDVTQRSYRVRSSFAGDPIAIRYLLSTDVSPDAADIVLGTEWLDPPLDTTLGLHAGAGPSLSIPPCVPAASSYYLLAQFDGTGVLAETDESNNDVSTAVTVDPAALPLDYDGDCDEDVHDITVLIECLAGPGVEDPPPGCTSGQFHAVMQDFDQDVDLIDFASVQSLFSP